MLTFSLYSDIKVYIKEVAFVQEKNEKEFYFIEWTVNGTTYKNHYYTNAIDIDYKQYITALSKYGMDEFEGFTPSDIRQVKM